MDAAQRGKRHGIFPPADQPRGGVGQPGRNLTEDAAPLIVSALFGAADFAWLDGLRRAHFPPERNRLAAHLTLFHHLPPSVEAELRLRLGGLTRGERCPDARAVGLLNLGRGTAVRIVSPALEELRGRLADAFRELLTPQDAASWQPHVTIQNKVLPEEAKMLRATLEQDFIPRAVAIVAIGLWRYRGGPWEPVSRHAFTPG